MTAMTDETVLGPMPAAPETEQTRHTCAISGLPNRKRDLVPLDAVRPSLADHIRKDHPA